ncbi:hypothetical protein ACFYMO_03765 [Streptomyces sp. NPDC007025]|uniref:hypothetical protein n=1 Tax=Streptomyces sp. NPDC007025 TaxID=3364771 RepID=UPI0036BF8840
MSDETVQPASNRMPIVTATNGQPYIAACNVLALLRAVADSCRNLADDPDCDLDTAAAAIDLEADALEVRAIHHTTE